MDILLIVGIIILSIFVLGLLIALGSILYEYVYQKFIPSNRIIELRGKVSSYKNKCDLKIKRIRQREQFKSNLQYLKNHDLLEEFYMKQDKKKK